MKNAKATSGLSRRLIMKGGLLSATAAFFGPWKHNHVWAQGAKPIRLGLTWDASGQYGNSGQDDLRGIRMAIAVRVNEFLGIACRATDEGQALVIAHRDPSLSIPLLVTSNGEQIEQAWKMWSDLLALPQIEEENDASREPAPRRRRHNAIRTSRPKFLVRRKSGHYLAQPLVHSDEREIIARN